MFIKHDSESAILRTRSWKVYFVHIINVRITDISDDIISSDILVAGFRATRFRYSVFGKFIVKPQDIHHLLFNLGKSKPVGKLSASCVMMINLFTFFEEDFLLLIQVADTFAKILYNPISFHIETVFSHMKLHVDKP